MITKQMQNILFPLTSGVLAGVLNWLFALTLNKFNDTGMEVTFWKYFLYGLIITVIVVYLYTILVSFLSEYFSGNMLARAGIFAFLLLSFITAIAAEIFAQDVFYIWSFFSVFFVESLFKTK